MKKLLVFFMAFAITFSHAQSVSIGTKIPAPSAILDVKSNVKGFLPPRMTYNEILAIPSPAPGLMVYNTSVNKPVYFDSLEWRYMNDVSMLPKVGDKVFGGIVFYVDPTGKHGWVAAPIDQSTSATWWNGTNIVTGAFSSSEGATNTTAIISYQGNTGLYAAKLCRDYRGGGYSDWYLPAKDQLVMLQAQMVVSGFGQNLYWSSTETSQSTAVDVYMYDGTVFLNIAKNTTDRVRAIRSF